MICVLTWGGLGQAFAVKTTIESKVTINEAVPASSNELVGDCAGCHAQQHSIKEVAISLIRAGKCNNCHEHFSDRGNSRTQHALARNEQIAPQIEQHMKSPSTSVRAADNDLRVAMYTNESRLGDAPNEMVLIPGGEFIMGTNDRLPDEGPQHRVTLDAFYIDLYEVTNLQYKKFNDETKRRSPQHFRNRTFPPGKADHPVTYVSWEDANAYCQWAGKRLPTEQEWEKAARGEHGLIFPWGNEFDVRKANTPLRWKQLGGFGDTTPVGAFESGKSPFGVYDMSGNVWEWTASWYKAYPNNKTESESYGERYKSLKGGSWFDCSFYNCGISAPVFNRAFFAPRTKNDSFGFRCAKDAI